MKTLLAAAAIAGVVSAVSPAFAQMETDWSGWNKQWDSMEARAHQGIGLQPSADESNSRALVAYPQNRSGGAVPQRRAPSANVHAQHHH